MSEATKKVGVSSRAQNHAAKMHEQNKKERYTPGVKPKTEKEWITISDDMLAWAELENSLVLDDFPRSKKYSPSKFKKWKDNEYFVDALDRSRSALSSRREKIALADGPGTALIIKTFHLYNQDSADWERERWNKQSENEGSKTIYVEVPVNWQAAKDADKKI